MKYIKKQIKSLTRQLKDARSHDRVLLLENQVKEKENAIQVLKKDNKMLLSIQRKQEKEINAKEELKLAWPHRITSLENDIRVYKEKNYVKSEHVILNLLRQGRNKNAKLKY